MSIGFAIGNGESRKSFDLRKLFGKGLTYGCNGLHRDFTVKNLVCSKLAHLQEAIEYNYHKKSLVFSTVELINILKDPYIELLPKIPYNIGHDKDKPENWSSGSWAILLAAMENDIVTIIGYDFTGKGERNFGNPFGYVNNIYADTSNYPKTKNKQRDMGFDVQQVGHIIQHFKDVKFIFINEWTPETFFTHDNAYEDSYENFENQLLTS